MKEERTASLLQKRKINKLMNKYDDKFFQLVSDSFERKKIRTFYQPFYSHYNNIICSIIELMRELNIDDPFMMCQSFVYLLYSGYFSTNSHSSRSHMENFCNIEASNSLTVMSFIRLILRKRQSSLCKTS